MKASFLYMAMGRPVIVSDAMADEEFRSAEAPAKCVSGEGASVTEVVWARAY